MILNGSSNYYGIILFNFACLLEKKKNPGQTEKQENKEVNFACKIIGFYFFFLVCLLISCWHLSQHQLKLIDRCVNNNALYIEKGPYNSSSCCIRRPWVSRDQIKRFKTRHKFPLTKIPHYVRENQTFPVTTACRDQ